MNLKGRIQYLEQLGRDREQEALNRMDRHKRLVRILQQDSKQKQRAVCELEGTVLTLRQELLGASTGYLQANALVSNQVPSSPTMPSVSTVGLIWSAVCRLPGMFKAAPEAVTVYCRPW